MALRVIDSVFLYSVFANKQKEADMDTKIMISRIDHTPEALRQPARKHEFRHCRHRMRAIARVIEDELSRAGIAGQAEVGARTLCDWVKRYNDRGLAGLQGAARPGRPPMPDATRAARVAAWLDAGEPCCWRVADIRERILDRFGVRCSIEGVRRLIRRLGFRRLSPRPIHPQADPQAQAAPNRTRPRRCSRY